MLSFITNELKDGMINAFWEEISKRGKSYFYSTIGWNSSQEKYVLVGFDHSNRDLEQIHLLIYDKWIEDKELYDRKQSRKCVYFIFKASYIEKKVKHSS